MTVLVKNPPVLETLRLEPTEQRIVVLDFSGVLSSNLSGVVITDADSAVVSSSYTGLRVTLLVSAGAHGDVATVTVDGVTLSTKRERQTLRIETIDPADDIEEVNP